MAKIGNLEVETINIAESSVTARVSRFLAGALVVANPSGMPVELYATVNSTYTSSTSGTGYTFTASVTGGGAMAGWSRTWTRNGNTGGASVGNVFTITMLDVSPGTSQSYSLNMSASNTGGDGSKFGFIFGTLTAITAKK